jgi:mannose-6-phosphate isomerase-like protein (cupin superfamily)
MRVRRVVTGHDSAGRSVFASDEEIEPIATSLLPGAEFHRLWSANDAACYPGPGTDLDAKLWFPPVGGFRFAFFTLPAGEAAQSPADMGAAVEEIQRLLPGLIDYMEPDEPGMHTTDTTDFEVVLSGDVGLELDDGAKRVLHAGDTVVQNGTRHRWTNVGSVPAVIAVFLVGARRAT